MSGVTCKRFQKPWRITVSPDSLHLTTAVCEGQNFLYHHHPLKIWILHMQFGSVVLNETVKKTQFICFCEWQSRVCVCVERCETSGVAGQVSGPGREVCIVPPVRFGCHSVVWCPLSVCSHAKYHAENTKFFSSLSHAQRTCRASRNVLVFKELIN